MTDSIFTSDFLQEDSDLEVKLAGGRDGKGWLPEDMWETYSAFANTDGGIILLGVKELKNGKLDPVGMEKPERVLDQLWSHLNNPNKVSKNLLQPSDVTRHVTDRGTWIISIRVPRATRTEQPVFINGNPHSGTYKRLHTGDYRCREEQVNRMLAEKTQDARDARILEGFSLEDIDMDSFKAYRNQLAALKPDHPYNNAENQEFMRLIGGWARDRQKHVEGLTLAGLLMFGKQVSIQEAVNHYFVDYREIPVAGTKTQWIDRITPDGTWSGNLYDFYRRTIKKLFHDIKVPFKLVGQEREDDTPVHKAIREALVNAIIHADYSAPVSILVEKAPDHFGFRNPGRMRIPVDKALEGGTSDSRNRSLQKMFSLINLGEQAGSGISRVVENWKTQHYRMPELWENDEPESTMMRLRMVSLLPENIIQELKNQFGSRFNDLSNDERLALVTAKIEGFVTNTRLQQICQLHPRDITLLLKKMVSGSYLIPDGQGRATTYRVAGSEPLDLAKSSAFLDEGNATEENLERSDGLTPRSDGFEGADGGNTLTINKEWGSGNFISSSDDLVSSSDDLDVKTDEEGDEDRDPLKDVHLLEMAKPISGTKYANSELVRETILKLCKGRFLSLVELAGLLRRGPNDLRQRFVKDLVESGELLRRFPEVPHHEQQAYRTAESKDE